MIKITLPQHISDEEKEIINECLSEANPEYGISNQGLFGIDAITIIQVLILPIATNAIYDILKTRILQLISNYNKKNRTYRIIISKNNKKILIEEDAPITTGENKINFSSLDEAIKYLEIEDE